MPLNKLLKIEFIQRGIYMIKAGSIRVLYKKALLTMLMSLVLILFVFTSINVVFSQANNDFSDKRVLFIASYSSEFNTFYQQIDGFTDTFKDYPVTVDVEFMDTKRFLTEENITNFYNSITYKLNYVDYDALMVSDDNALDFVMDHQDELFSNIPIVFFGINSETHAENYSEDPNVSGVVENVSITETIDLALDLIPQANKVIALVDKTPSGQADLQRFLTLEDTYPDLVFTKIDMSEMSMANFLADLNEVDETSIVILLSALRDIDDVTYSFSDSVDLLVENSNVPIFHLYEHGIGEGLLGGKVISHYNQGTIAAQMLLSVFKGEMNISEVALVRDNSNIYFFDYKVLEKYDLDLDKLPADTKYINRELSFYQQYKSYVICGVIFSVFMVAIIIVLAWSLKNGNKARQDALDSKQKLEEANVGLKTVNKKLEHISYHDSLTGLYNRTFFEKKFVLLNKEKHFPLSLILGDVNGLKLVNDAFGHLVGDKVLTTSADLLREAFPESVISRIGGDEFAVIAVNMSKEEVSERISKLREKAEKNIIGGVKLSISLGFVVKAEENISIHDMYINAENSMYREKMYQVPSNRSAIIETIITTLNQKDIYSELHSKRVSVISTKIAEYLKLDSEVISRVKTAGLLHDIGKIIVPTDILMKTGKLTNDEYEEIKKHSEIGFRILNSAASLKDIAEIVFCHHERMDGRGYPRGLKGKKIPIESRIIGIADALDAMLNDRLYRNKLSKEKCYQELVDNSGTQFCSATIKVVLENYDEIYRIASQ